MRSLVDEGGCLAKEEEEARLDGARGKGVPRRDGDEGPEGNDGTTWLSILLAMERLVHYLLDHIASTTQAGAA